MADAADVAFELADARVSRGLATIAADIPAGVEGECDDCGENMPRLVDGRCGFCRDGRKPPLSFYADRAAAPPALASTTKEHVPMAQTTPVAPGRKIMIEGEALKAVERIAEADQTSWKQAADKLIVLGLGLSLGVLPSNPPMSGGVLSVASTDELFAELQARFEVAQSNAVMEAELRSANARADAAEGTLANLKAVLG